MDIGDTFMEAIVVAFGGSFTVGIIWIIKMLLRIAHDMRAMVPSMRTLYRIQPYLAEAIRFQNAALVELGANGSTEKSNACLDEVDRVLNEKLADNSIGKA